MKVSRWQTMRASENPRSRLRRRGHGTNRKPSSVSALARGDGHLSGMAVAGHLEQPTRGSPLPVLSVWVTPRRLFGLAPTGGCSAARCYQERGGLLPHPFTLTPSVACASSGRFAFCCPVRRLSAPRRYLAVYPAELGLSSERLAPPRDQPVHPVPQYRSSRGRSEERRAKSGARVGVRRFLLALG